MDNNVIRRIRDLREMTVHELRAEWLRLNGEPARSHNRDYLWRRLAWRVQELAHGGLTDRTKIRIEELSQDGLLSAPTPKRGPLVTNVEPGIKSASRCRDPRLPTPGSVITKNYKGQELRVVVRDDGFEFDGTMFPSLTAVAKNVTGCRSINGRLFFGLSTRKR